MMNLILYKKICNYPQNAGRILSGQEGSVLIVAMLILVLMTLGGITATKRSTTESFTIRNTAIHKQNLLIAESGAMEGAGEILKTSDLSADWIHDKSNWNDNPDDADVNDSDSYPLTNNNSRIPVSVENGVLSIIEQRGEIVYSGGNITDSSVRYYFVGWDHFEPPGRAESLGEVRASRHGAIRQGRVVGVYNSERYGNKTIEIGVRKRVIPE